MATGPGSGAHPRCAAPPATHVGTRRARPRAPHRPSSARAQSDRWHAMHTLHRETLPPPQSAPLRLPCSKHRVPASHHLVMTLQPFAAGRSVGDMQEASQWLCPCSWLRSGNRTPVDVIRWPAEPAVGVRAVRPPRSHPPGTNSLTTSPRGSLGRFPCGTIDPDLRWTTLSRRASRAYPERARYAPAARAARRPHRRARAEDPPPSRDDWGIAGRARRSSSADRRPQRAEARSGAAAVAEAPRPRRVVVVLSRLGSSSP